MGETRQGDGGRAVSLMGAFIPPTKWSLCVGLDECAWQFGYDFRFPWRVAVGPLTFTLFKSHGGRDRLRVVYSGRFRRGVPENAHMTGRMGK